MFLQIENSDSIVAIVKLLSSPFLFTTYRKIQIVGNVDSVRTQFILITRNTNRNVEA